MSSGIDLIAAERQRQIESEGWSAEHDDVHTSGELAAAAITYASPFVSIRAKSLLNGEHVCPTWPWDKESYKPTPDDRVRELVKAGALIVAEIERLQRLASLEATP